MSRRVHLLGVAVAVGAWIASCESRVARVVDAAMGAMGDGSANEAGAQDPTGGIDSRSGSRIQARRLVYTGADGTRYDTGATELVDTMLGTTCVVGPSSDGKLRCLPPTGSTSGGLFSDAQCTQPVAYDTSRCSVPATYAGQGVWTCDAYAMSIYSVGAEYLGPVYVKSGAGTCVASTRIPTYAYYNATLLTPTTFVEFTKP